MLTTEHFAPDNPMHLLKHMLDNISHTSNIFPGQLGSMQTHKLVDVMLALKVSYA